MLEGSMMSYAIPLLIGAGLFLLRIDVAGYRMAKLDKELKVARYAGWFDLTVGLIMLAWMIIR